MARADLRLTRGPECGAYAGVRLCQEMRLLCSGCMGNEQLRHACILRRLSELRAAELAARMRATSSTMSLGDRPATTAAKAS